MREPDLNCYSGPRLTRRRERARLTIEDLSDRSAVPVSVIRHAEMAPGYRMNRECQRRLDQVLLPRPMWMS